MAVLTWAANADNWIPISRSLTQESCPNGTVDPGETNIIDFVIKNDTDTEYGDVQFELLADGAIASGISFTNQDSNVEFVLTGVTSKQTVGGKGQVSVSFAFRAKGTCGRGNYLTPRVLVKRGEADKQIVTFDGDKRFQLGATVADAHAFSNTASITINDPSSGSGKASPYPSTITVSGVPHSTAATGERVVDIAVTLNNVTHPTDADISALLVGPNGGKAVLLRNAGNFTGLSGATFTINGTASASVPRNAPIISGSTYKAADYGSGDFPTPAPAGAYGALGSVFDDADPNGTWQLYVLDNNTGGAGVIAGGWTLTVKTERVVCCGAGETFPAITQNRDNRPQPSISGVTIPEDTVFVSDDASGGQVDSPAIPFIVNDLESDESALAIAITSSNEGLIKASNVKVGGSGANRTLEFRTESNQNGTSAIAVLVTDPDGNTSSASFTLTVNSVNDVPTFPTTVRNQAVNVGTGTPALAFTVTDVETAPDFLTLTAVSDDQDTVPDSNIFFSGAGTSRTVTVLPRVTGSTSGDAVITVRATDASGATGTMVFKVDFSTPVGNPTISPFDTKSIDEDGSATLGFTIRSGSSTPVDSLTLSISSSRPGLIPVGNLSINGTGSERTLTIAPVANMNSVNAGGDADIAITVADGARSSTTHLIVHVNPINDKPTISAVGAQSITEDSSTGEILVTVSDIETTNAAQINVNGASGNEALVPSAVSNGTTPGIQILPKEGVPNQRVVKIIPNPNAFGRALIVLSATELQAVDGVGPDITYSTFTLDVLPVNDAPTVSQVNGQNLADNSDDAPVVALIDEDTGVTDADHIAAQDLAITGIFPGVGTPAPQNEVEQTVSLSAAVSNTSIISSAYFSDGESTLQYPTTGRTLHYKLVPNAYGDVTITLTARDNGTGALGADTMTTVRKFIVRVNPLNDAPSLAAISNRTVPAGSSAVVGLDVSDVETADADIDFVATSSNQAVVKNENIIFDATGSLMSVTTEAGVFADTTITVTATDLGPKNDGSAPKLSATRSFVLTSENRPPNNPPVITSISPEATTIVEDSLATAKVFVSDPDAGETATLTLSASSSNENIVPVSNILFGGSGAERTVAIRPAANANGTVTITITAIDHPGQFASIGKPITVNVVAVEDSPSISVTQSTDDGTKWSGGTITALEGVSPIADPKTSSKLVEVKVSDPETPADSLTVTASSSNTSLIPNGNIAVSSTGGTRTLTISPVADLWGESTITVKVKDGAGNEVPATFKVAVTPVNDEPTLNALSDLTISEDATLQSVTVSGITAGSSEGGQTLTLSVSVKDTGSDPAVNNILENITLSPTTIVTPANNAAQTAVLRFQPIANKFGSSTITIKVVDNGGTDNSGDNTKEVSFKVTTQEVNDVPTVLVPTLYQSVSLQPNGQSDVIPISVSDIETSPSALTVTAVSDNPQLIPNTSANLQHTGSGNSRGLIIKPAANLFGTANVTVTVADAGKADGTGVQSASQIIKVTVTAGQNPVISSIPNQSTKVNVDTDIITFTVSDAQTSADQLRVSAVSDNTTVIPNANIQFGGSGSSRAMIIRPAKDQSGIANITVTVTDGNNNTGSTTFKLTVLGQPPTITKVVDQVVQKGGTTGSLSFQVSDDVTFAGFLTVTASSSNKTLVPDSNLFLGGSGANRTINAALAAGQTGETTITLTVTDGEGQTASSTFKISTGPEVENTAPTISSIANQQVKLGQSVPIITFTVGDKETSVADLAVTATASNTTLVPASGIFLGSSGATRSLLITPAANQTGSATIVVTVADGGGKTASTSFTLTVSKEVVVVKNDFNGDNLPDILLQDADGFVAAWFMSGDDVLSGSFLTPNNVGDAGWKLIGTGDFNSDNKTDILYQHTDGTLAVWYMDGVTLSSAAFLNPSSTGSSDWKAVATGDINKDGKVDVLFQHTDGTLAIWYLNGVNLLQAAYVNPANPSDVGWKLVATGDVNNDGDADLWFQHTDGSLGVWYLKGASLMMGALANPENTGPDWRAVGSVDLNQDGRSDLLMQNQTTGDTGVWYMNGANLISGALINAASGTWKIVAP